MVGHATLHVNVIGFQAEFQNTFSQLEVVQGWCEVKGCPIQGIFHCGEACYE